MFEGTEREIVMQQTLMSRVGVDRVLRFADVGPDMPTALAMLKGVWRALASGYTSTSGFQPMDQLASRGGMDSMLNTIWLIVSALAFGGVVEKAGEIIPQVVRVETAARTGAEVPFEFPTACPVCGSPTNLPSP